MAKTFEAYDSKKLNGKTEDMLHVARSACDGHGREISTTYALKEELDHLQVEFNALKSQVTQRLDFLIAKLNNTPTGIVGMKKEE